MSITEFLKARIDDDEARVEFVRPFIPDEGNQGEYIDPARILAECEAKRQIVQMHRPKTILRIHKPGAPIEEIPVCAYDTDEDSHGWIDYPCDTLRILAEVYRDCPDYDEEWRV